MANTTYSVTLSTNGGHTVSVSGDDPVAVSEAARDWAADLFHALSQSKDRHPTSKPAIGDESADTAVPVCPAHELPMVRQEGKHGPFWSCHQRNADGRFCSYRPPEA